MQDPTAVIARDAWHYLPAGASLALEFGVARLRRAARPGTRVLRPHSDATWFVPVHLWGLCSLYHACWFLFGDGPRGCWGVPVWVFGSHAGFSWAVLAVVLSLCFLAEHVARRRGAPVRHCRATLPLPLLATILGVAGCWLLLFLAIVPLFP